MKNILEYLEKRASSHGDKIGFSDPEHELSFSGMQDLSERIGTFLSTFGTGRPVAVFTEKSVECIACMFGALYAGDYYVVIDVHSPAERQKAILNTLKDPLVLCDEKSEDICRSVVSPSEPVSFSRAAQTGIDRERLAEIRREAIDTDVAYVLFTSGSTGVPKGAVITHRALIAYTDWVTEAFSFDETTVFGSQSPLYFSMSVTDLYSTVKCAGAFHIIPREKFSFPVELVGYLNEKKVNTLYWVPTALSLLANWKTFDVVRPAYLKTVLFAGEVMPVKQLNYWIKNLPSDVRYANLFGPTETTDICTYYVVDRAFEDTDSLPIGRHCDNCGVMIIGEDGKEAAPGEEGELYVRGSFLAEGYLGNPQKTAEAFVQNPLNPLYPERVYRTGDLVKTNESGEILYLSRKDFQIKRSGFRIELGEIEAAANSVPRVKNCACVYAKEKDLLVLLYEGGPKDSSLVRDAVAGKVPAYMMPDRFVRVAEMPVNANGKIDRKALLAEISVLPDPIGSQS